ncbi:SDR family NAD(P)-dependent oxidoreductase [Amycolatopsis sp. GM8]|uniref:SDR family NAD(P)-dependent oxidoreductase n=1 Tax=Amycolatopsis sp. GM8 TaxID=2896530 RepID=UPI001F1F634D|nr:SDR family oxidoreductase [Amycolatopsis sp. GM8]
MSTETEAGRKVAVVTGAASGIGAATARLLAKNGYAVVATDISPAVHELERMTTLVLDLTDESANARLVAEAEQTYGRLDAVVLNAGTAAFSGIEETSIAEYDRIMAINVRALVLGMQAAVPLLRRTRGAISVTCSIDGLLGKPKLWAYAASKAAAVNLVRSVALELASDGVRVNGVCPGPIAQTGMTAHIERDAPDRFAAMGGQVPLQRWGTADEVAAAHLFAVSPRSAFMTGAMITVDGGVTAGTGVCSPNDAQ